MKAPAPTSDGKERPNTLSVTLPAIPTSIGENKRIGVLADIGATLKAAGATINPVAYNAAYSQNFVTQRINDIITAANALGATPAMKTYLSVDYNAFTSVMKVVTAGIATIP